MACPMKTTRIQQRPIQPGHGVTPPAPEPLLQHLAETLGDGVGAPLN